MSTSAPSKRRKKKNEPSQEPAQEKSTPKAGRSGGRLRRYVIGFGLLALLAWSAPMIVGYTPLRNYALGVALKDLNGTVSTSSASLGWFSPATLHDVEIRDDRGDLVLRAPTIRTSRSLQQIAANLSSIGRIEVHRPELRVRFDEKSSNVERAFDKYLNSKAEPTLSSPALELEIIDATAVIEDHVTRQSWKLQSLGAKIELARDWATPMALRAAGQLARGGHFDAQVSLAKYREADGSIGTSGTVNCNTDRFPLAIADPLVRRFTADTHVAGWLGGKAAYQWGQTPAGPRMVVDAALDVKQLVVRSPALNRETLQLASVELPCRIECQGNQLRIDRLAPKCDVGGVELKNGPLVIDLSGGAQGLVQASQNNNYEINGSLDVAKLAQLLPQTLSVREGTEITDGKLHVSVARRQDAGSGGWRGRLSGTSLRAMNQGRPVSWEKPIEAEFDVEYTAASEHKPADVIVNSLTCSSDGLFDLEGAGRLVSGNVRARLIDLNRLTQELGQFFDLGGLELAGTGTAELRWHRQADGRLDFGCRSLLKNFVLGQGGRRLWDEESLQLALSAAANPDAKNPHVRNLGANLHVTSGDDQLKAWLVRPVAVVNVQPSAETPGAGTLTSWQLPPDQVWPLKADLRGDIGRWMARVESVLGPQAWQFAGQGHVMATVEASPKLIDIQGVQAAVSGFRARTDGLLIDEPELVVQLIGKWHAQAGRADVELVELLGKAVKVKSQQATLTLPQSGETLPTVQGDLQFQADLDRVHRWLRRSPLDRLAGTADGWAQFRHGSETATAKINADVKELVVKTDRKAKPWKDPKVTVQGEVRYDRAGDLLEILGLDVKSQTKIVDGRVGGRIARLSDRQELDLSGNLTYDLQQIVTLLCPAVADEVRIEGGRREHPFTLKGQLGETPGGEPKPLLARLQTGTEVNWTGADVFGFRFDTGRVQAQLQNGQVHFAPINVSVNNGRLAAQPRVNLVSTPAKAFAQGGRILDRVQITPQMCNRGLQYALPMLYGVSQAEGRFSVDLNDGCVIPLDDPKRSKASGQLTVHDVKLTPGPVLRSVAQALDAVSLATGKQGRFASQLRVAQLKRESVIPYEMAGGRFTHRDMELDFGGTKVSTSGWVDMNNQQMNLVAKVASPKLARAAPGMKGGEIIIPITGTPQQPRIDHGRLLKSIPGLIGGGLLEQVPGADKLRDGLDKKAGDLFRGMFGPRK